MNNVLVKSLMKEHLVETHTIRQTEIPALRLGLQTHLLSKSCAHNKIASPYVFVKT
jgi:hypothetical protein